MADAFCGPVWPDAYPADWPECRSLIISHITETQAKRRELYTELVQSLDKLPADLAFAIGRSHPHSLWIEDLSIKQGRYEVLRKRLGLNIGVDDNHISGHILYLLRRDTRAASAIQHVLTTAEGRQARERFKESPGEFAWLVSVSIESFLRIARPLRKERTPKEVASRRKTRIKEIERSLSLLEELQMLSGSDFPLVPRRRLNVLALTEDMQRLLTINGAIAAIRERLKTELDGEKFPSFADPVLAAGMMSRKQNDHRQNYLRILLWKLRRSGFPIKGNLEGAIYPVARIIAGDHDMEPHHVIQAAKNVHRFALNQPRWPYLAQERDSTG